MTIKIFKLLLLWAIFSSQGVQAAGLGSGPVLNKPGTNRTIVQQGQSSSGASQGEPVLNNNAAGIESRFQAIGVQTQTNNSSNSAPVLNSGSRVVNTPVRVIDGTPSVTDTASSEGEQPVEALPVAGGGITMTVGIALTGQILDPSGQAVPNITVKAIQDEQTLFSVTDVNGQYQFSLAQGIWSVSATDLDYDITPAQKVYNVQGYGFTRIE